MPTYGSRGDSQGGGTSGLRREIAGQTIFAELDNVLTVADLKGWLERRCCGYHDVGRGRSISPDLYLRMLLVGLLDGLTSFPEIAARCKTCDHRNGFLRLEAESAPLDEKTLKSFSTWMPFAIHRKASVYVRAQLADIAGMSEPPHPEGLGPATSGGNEVYAATLARLLAEDKWLAFLKILGIVECDHAEMTRFDRRYLGLDPMNHATPPLPSQERP